MVTEAHVRLRRTGSGKPGQVACGGAAKQPASGALPSLAGGGAAGKPHAAGARPRWGRGGPLLWAAAALGTLLTLAIVLQLAILLDLRPGASAHTGAHCFCRCTLFLTPEWWPVCTCSQ